MLCRFIIKDRETFFTAAQRSQVVWQIMMRAKYDDSEKVRCENMLNKSLTLKNLGSWNKRYCNGFDQRVVSNVSVNKPQQ
jgi:hypothetical protein